MKGRTVSLRRLAWSAMEENMLQVEAGQSRCRQTGGERKSAPMTVRLNFLDVNLVLPALSVDRIPLNLDGAVVLECDFGLSFLSLGLHLLSLSELRSERKVSLSSGRRQREKEKKKTERRTFLACCLFGFFSPFASVFRLGMKASLKSSFNSCSRSLALELGLAEEGLNGVDFAALLPAAAPPIGIAWAVGASSLSAPSCSSSWSARSNTSPSSTGSAAESLLIASSSSALAFLTSLMVGVFFLLPPFAFLSLPRARRGLREMEGGGGEGRASAAATRVSLACSWLIEGGVDCSYEASVCWERTRSPSCSPRRLEVRSRRRRSCNLEISD